MKTIKSFDSGFTHHKPTTIRQNKYGYSNRVRRAFYEEKSYINVRFQIFSFYSIYLIRHRADAYDEERSIYFYKSIVSIS